LERTTKVPLFKTIALFLFVVVVLKECQAVQTKPGRQIKAKVVLADYACAVV
jgi:hypothetical protein